MPVIKCPNGKYRIGSGKCMYTSHEKAVRAYQAYLAQHPEENEKLESELKVFSNP